MKITLPITALAAVLGLAFAGIPIHAATASATASATATGTTTATAPAAAKKTKYSGTLSAVDATAGTITVTDKTVGPKTLTVSATTKIKKDGKLATLADFKVGDKVGGSFTTDASGTMTALTVSENAPKKDKAAKTAKAPATPATTPAAQ